MHVCASEDGLHGQLPLVPCPQVPFGRGRGPAAGLWAGHHGQLAMQACYGCHSKHFRQCKATFRCLEYQQATYAHILQPALLHYYCISVACCIAQDPRRSAAACEVQGCNRLSVHGITLFATPGHERHSPLISQTRASPVCSTSRERCRGLTCLGR